MFPLELVKLTALMERTSGSPEVTIGLIDGPVATQHADLAGKQLARFMETTGQHALRPIARHVCTGPL
jgi:hypothetical protein